MMQYLQSDKKRIRRAALVMLAALYVIVAAASSGVLAIRSSASGDSVASIVSQAAAGSDLATYLSTWSEPVRGSMDTVSYRMDFDDEEADTNMTQIVGFDEYWDAQNATGTHISVVEFDGDNGYLRMNPFSQVVSKTLIEGAYVLQYETKIDDNQGAGVFIRATDEAMLNPYFEDDGSGISIEGIGGSGIYIVPRKDKLKVFVKKFNSDAANQISNEFVQIEAGVDFTTAFHKITIADNGSTAAYFVDDRLIFTATFSNLSDDLDYISDYFFYTNTVIKDAQGTELLNVADSLICAEGSCIAFGLRINSMAIDNIAIDEVNVPCEIALTATPKTDYKAGDEFDVGGGRLTVTYADGTTRELLLRESMVSGFDASVSGEQELTVSYMGATTSYKVTSEGGPASSTADTTTEPTSSDATPAAGTSDTSNATGTPQDQTDADVADDNDYQTLIVIIIACVAVAAIVVIIFFVRKSGKAKKS